MLMDATVHNATVVLTTYAVLLCCAVLTPAAVQQCC
jgi:hypothetical protein